MDNKRSFQKRIFLAIIVFLLLAGCNPNALLENAILTSDVKGSAITSSNPPVIKTSSVTLTSTQTPTLTSVPPTVTFTLTPTVTFTFTPTLTATWPYVQAGKVVAPILLYHHVSDDVSDNRYYISTSTFDEQMKLLHDWGYTAIPISVLVTALTKGGELPPRPVVITFDDGNQDIYQNAFPIMEKYGFCGTFYIIEDTLGAKDYVTTDNLLEMIAAGWEIGSHSKTHVDLTKNHASLAQEVAYSRLDLEKILNVPINTFAYPFGLIDTTVVDKVANDGYTAAVGLGTSTTHTLATLYYLNREEVQNAYDMDKFKTLLPWQGTP